MYPQTHIKHLVQGLFCTSFSLTDRDRVNWNLASVSPPLSACIQAPGLPPCIERIAGTGSHQMSLKWVIHILLILELIAGTDKQEGRDFYGWIIRIPLSHLTSPRLESFIIFLSNDRQSHGSEPNNSDSDVRVKLRQ